jgi:hypothetical protein
MNVIAAQSPESDPAREYRYQLSDLLASLQPLASIQTDSRDFPLRHTSDRCWWVIVALNNRSRATLARSPLSVELS